MFHFIAGHNHKYSALKLHSWRTLFEDKTPVNNQLYDYILREIPSIAVFEYAPVFGSAPSNASNMAWSRLFPEQGGFFQHPALAPQRSAFAVFHQLHCLDGIRQGYYALHAAAITGQQIDDIEMPMMSSPRHIAHCIDLIRQSLMCRPDTTVEVKNESVGGVTGFGTRHLCRDWQGLMAWTTEWQTFDQEEREKSERRNSTPEG